MIPRRLRAEIPSAIPRDQSSKHRKIPTDARNFQMPATTRTNQVIRMRNDSHRPNLRQAHRTHSNRQRSPPLKHERYRIPTPNETMVQQGERCLCSATLFRVAQPQSSQRYYGCPMRRFCAWGATGVQEPSILLASSRATIANSTRWRNGSMRSARTRTRSPKRNAMEAARLRLRP